MDIIVERAAIFPFPSLSLVLPASDLRVVDILDLREDTHDLDGTMGLDN
jgi:hypothetical protein